MQASTWAAILFLSLCPLNGALHAPTVEYSLENKGEGNPAAQVPVVEKDVALIQREEKPGDPISFRKVAAEFLAMTLFVYFGCGSAMSVANEPGWVLQVALTFGLAITVLAYTIGHYSGAQINCAVTFGLMLNRQVGWGQGLLNIVGQLLGSIFGAGLLKITYPADKDLTGGLGTNGIADGWSWKSALAAEFFGTFLLMYVVLETAVNKDTAANSSFAPLAIGLAVFLAHSVLIPIDGCSINPTRSFGPAFVQLLSGKKDSEPMKDMWVFWAGPLTGAAAAFGIYQAIN